MTLKAKAMLVGGAALLIVGLIVSTELCIPAWYRWGMRVKFCPDGEVRPVARLSAWGLKRGLPGVVELAADAEYVLEGSEYRKTAPLRRIQPALALVDKTGRETSLEPRKDWSGETMRRGEVTLPEVPDGDYLLRARIATPAGEAVAEAPLALYAPARVHVLTDRPLYEPGNTVRFRAVVLRAADLSPIDARPGVWKVIDPEGEVLLEEKAPAGEWGVVSGSFPLDSAAASGEWRVSWSSGEASGDTTFSVRPFTLPRFNVTASADKPFYGPGGQPKVKGQVTYSSGAPVAGAEVSLEWSSSGA
ncbi:MAG: MG2 domain-containing protein, partial [Myxococcales bacterium]